jgi:hypothetical protein
MTVSASLLSGRREKVRTACTPEAMLCRNHLLVAERRRKLASHVVAGICKIATAS